MPKDKIHTVYDRPEGAANSVKLKECPNFLKAAQFCVKKWGKGGEGVIITGIAPEKGDKTIRYKVSKTHKKKCARVGFIKTSN